MSRSRHNSNSSGSSIVSSPEVGGVPTLVEQLKMAKELQSRQKRQFRNLKRDYEDVKDMHVRDLLTVDVRKYIQRAEVLSEDYTSNSKIIHEIMETEEKEELQEALDGIDVDI